MKDNYSNLEYTTKLMQSHSHKWCCNLRLCRVVNMSIKPASHCPIISESEGTQSVVQSDEICSDCFGPIVLIRCPTVEPNFSVTVKITSDRPTDPLRLLFSPNGAFRLTRRD